MTTEVLKIYGDRKSQPTRAVMLFCNLNGIEFEEHTIELFNQEHLSPEFQEINPVREIPVIFHGDLRLFESHAILIYLASVFPDVANHWYPADAKKRALVHSVLDWHHCHLRRGAMGYLLNTILAPARGLTMNPQSAAECEKILNSALWHMESFWLKDTGKFLLGYDQPSIADLSLVCELMQFEVLDAEEKNNIFSPYKKVQQWIENIKEATRPQFDDVHKHLLFEDRPRFREAVGRSAS
ncbi:glutathione S-transferase T1 isoform X1 [Beta vulgaris subsp. vulgaris]|uniref:glutathione S-transferase T1 isoform X1 n=1 Tax=Beta vulgaris subsp. vulgaris TaxID=3555 RepID=UPI002036EE34|nr:glutathione S-transferase T1 isoform X1 [Beta vulgaris subsp. vulgaris]